MSGERYKHRYPNARAKRGMSIEDRLRLKAGVTPDGCWLFQGATIRTGYAQLGIGGRLHYVHRLSYETFVGPIPEGMQIDHLCRRRSCFNPAHLEPVTCGENIRRGWASRRAERRAA